VRLAGSRGSRGSRCHVLPRRAAKNWRQADPLSRQNVTRPCRRRLGGALVGGHHDQVDVNVSVTDCSSSRPIPARRAASEHDDQPDAAPRSVCAPDLPGSPARPPRAAGRPPGPQRATTCPGSGTSACSGSRPCRYHRGLRPRCSSRSPSPAWSREPGAGCPILGAKWERKAAARCGQERPT
jgi:hypothetical protein